jgi:DNA replication licensing factor MCM6
MANVYPQDNVLLQIRGEGLADDQGEGLAQDERVIYVLHPNCAVEEM